MATPISADIWHLSIDDLLAPMPESPRLGGPGPFVINLSASTAPISQPRKEAVGCDGAYVYQVQRTEDRRVRYRLRLGPFVTEDDAEAILAKVRDVYPSALTATAEPDDLRMISSLRVKNEPRQPATSAKVPVEAPAVASPLAAPTAPLVAPTLELAPVAPSLRIAPPVVRTPEVPVVPAKVVSAPVLAPVPAPAKTMIATAEPPAAAAQITPTAAKLDRAAPPNKLPPNRAPSNDISKIPVLTQVASMEPRAAATAKVTPAPAPPVSAVPTLTEAGVVWPPLTSGPVSAEPPWVSTATAQLKTPPPVRVVVPATPSTLSKPTALPKTPPALKTVIPPLAKSLAAATPALLARSKIATAPLRSALAPMAATPAARTPVRVPAPAAMPSHVEKLNTPLPNLESTQTLRPLTALELEDTSASQWFVIQLSASEIYFDPDSLPNLDIFSMYRLYAVTGIDQGKVLHALRLGFFSEEIAAKAVASYLAGFYEKPTIKRVSNAERERFGQQRLEARKDIGATGKHAAIEITGDRIARKTKSAPATDTLTQPQLRTEKAR